MYMEDFSKYNGEGTTLRKAQLRMVEMLIEIDKICKKNSINYWIDYGTLLGAVRHKGFIPWDDDIDICVLKKDYKKIRKCLINDLPDQFVFSDWKTDKYIFEQIGRVRDKKSYCYYPYFTKQKEQGLWIDIFPFEPMFSLKIKTIVDRTHGRIFRQTHNFGEVIYQNKVKRYFVKMFSYALAPISYLFLWSVRLCNYLSGTKKYGLVYTECAVANPIIDIRDIFPCQQIEFEGHLFLAPNNVEAILSKRYGNYMQLPPIDKRNNTYDLSTLQLID